MGPVSGRLGPKVYLDANFFIYALEGIEPWVRVARRILTALDDGECIGITSELTLAECLVKPLELGRSEIADRYREFLLDRPSLGVVPVSRQILEGAAGLRALSKIKLPDAIHAATARQQRCSSFLTNDGRLRIEGIDVLHWKDLEALGS